MGAFLTSLASIANQFGEAKEGARQEKEAQAEKLRSMDVQDAYLQLAKQADARQQQELDTRTKQGDLLKVGNRLWSVSKGGWVENKPADPLGHFKKLISSLPQDIQEGATGRVQSILEADPGDEKGAITEGMRFLDAQKAEANRREDANKAEESRRTDAHTRETERRDDKKESEAANERLQKMMVDFRLAEKQQYMTPQERQVYDTIKQVEPSVQRTIDFLEKIKDSDGKTLKDENDAVFGNRSALMQHLRFKGYKFGVKGDDITQELIKNAALIQVLGARPWMTMGRGKFIYETIAQHLPSSTDTPSLMYDKLVWLRDNVLDDAKTSLSGYVAPGGAQQPNTPSGGNNDPLGMLQ